MVEWISSLFEQYGYWGLALAMFLENVVPPIPSEAVLPAAGIAVRQGHLAFVWTILAATAGSVLGVTPWFYVGRWVGRERLALWADRRGKWLGISRKDVQRADIWFDRYGHVAVLVGRMVPGIRTLISVPAGLAGMGLLRFLLYSAAGTAGWSAALIMVGWWLGRDSERLTTGLSWLGVAVLVSLCGYGVWWIMGAHRG